MSTAPSRGVWLAGGVLIAAGVFAFAEVALWLFPRFAGSGVRSFIYVPPEVTREQYETYLASRDPVLGWPAANGSGAAAMPTARPSPAQPGAREWCVTLYGDSFTYSDEVSDTDAWGNALAQLLGCPVGNFGVSGYGTDQALLRFNSNSSDRAAVTLVGVFVDNVLRNVNQYRYFLGGGETLGLKPRFILEEGALRLVALPQLTYDQFVAGLRDASPAFPSETFLPGSAYGPVVWSFPYTLSLFKLVRSPRVSNYLRGRPNWIDFYHPEIDSRALLTTIAIIAEFRQRAATERSVIAVLFPSPASYKQTQETGRSTFESLVAGLRARGIPSLDLTFEFAAHLGARSFCELWSDPDACVGHYNAEGNAVVARAVREQLVGNGLLERVP